MNLEDLLFDLDDYELIRKIGNGCYASVYVVRRKKDGHEFAEKIFREKSNNSVYDQKYILRESLIQHGLNHPSVIKFEGLNFVSFKDPSKFQLTILLEYCRNGTLQTIISNERKSIFVNEWTPTKKYISLLGITHVMQYLHENGIIHRGLKPNNVLLDDNFYPKLFDFGYSRKFPHSLDNSMLLTMTTNVGTPLYMEPELFDNDTEQYSSGVDVYAFGILAYELVTLKLQYDELGHGLNLFKLYSKVRDGYRPKFPEDINQKMKFLISRCLCRNAQERPSFKEIFETLSKDFSYCNDVIDEDEVNDYNEGLKESEKKLIFKFDSLIVE